MSEPTDQDPRRTEDGPLGSGGRTDNHPARKRRLWIWFLAGFLIVFLGLSLTKTMYPLNRSGTAVIECKLWEYYVIEVQRAAHSSGNLGLTTGSTETAITIASQHLLFSAVGGGVMVGIALMVRKLRG